MTNNEDKCTIEDSEWFTDPEKQRIYRETLEERLRIWYNFKSGLSDSEKIMIMIVVRNYRGNFGKQADMLCCIAESMARAESLGNPPGVIPTVLLFEIAKKWKVTKGIRQEMILLMGTNIVAG